MRLLLFAATTGYQIREFASAGARLGIDIALATDRCLRMDDPWGDGALAVKFDHRMAATVEGLRGLAFDGVAAVGDGPAEAAALAAEMFGVPFHPPATARACRDKFLARQLYQAAGLRTPWFFRAALDGDAGELAARAQYPCVLKPLGLSASRGVIRANDREEFQAAFRRIGKIGEKHLQVEGYIPGREFAVEGLVTGGRFQALAIFDKPDPLEGPYFEETIYVTPSRQPAEVQRALLEAVERAVRALGFRHGPVHAELRYNDEGAWMLEMHARPIGGLCARALRFEGGMTLEELILRHAVGEDVAQARLAGGASGVMMIPIPKGGIYQGAEGVARAQAVAGIEDVAITATGGQRLVPLPEGASYLGFIFARMESAGQVEAALRQAHGELRFEIATTLETFPPGI
ncbi:MAG TPA: ATP-grasp domain-containing protein [Bryobacteraceae bacterium]|jgi:biotin carboxylase|nr:ATP-grasp domain-containing protein [Bryobacteraceae bacterium]